LLAKLREERGRHFFRPFNAGESARGELIKKMDVGKVLILAETIEVKMKKTGKVGMRQSVLVKDVKSGRGNLDIRIKIGG